MTVFAILVHLLSFTYVCSFVLFAFLCFLYILILFSTAGSSINIAFRFSLHNNESC